jgi:hypothetical protein
MDYLKPDVVAYRRNQEGTPVVRGGDVVVSVVCKGLGADTAETNEALTMPNNQTFQNVLSKAGAGSPLKSINKVGDTAGASDYQVGVSCVKVDPNKVDFSSAPNLVPPSLDDPVLVAGGSVPVGVWEYFLSVIDKNSNVKRASDGVVAVVTPTLLTSAGGGFGVIGLYEKAVLRILSGALAGQERVVVSHTDTILTVSPAFTTPLGAIGSYSTLDWEVVLGETVYGSLGRITTRSSYQSVRLTWGQVKNATGYKVYRAKVAEGTVTGVNASKNAHKNIQDSTATFLVNRFGGGTLEIISGTGSGQTRTILNNTSTEIVVSVAWTVDPDTTSTYKVTGPPTYAQDSGSATDEGLATTLIDTTKNWCDDQWNTAVGLDSWVVFTTGGHVGEVRKITDTDSATQKITFATVTTPVLAGEGYVIVSTNNVQNVTSIALGSTTTYLDTAASLVATTYVVPPFNVNTAYNRPGRGDIYYVSYTYKSFTYTTPVRYYSAAQVYADHGVGSEAGNAARVVLGKSGQGQGAKAMEICIPASDSVPDYIAAVDAYKLRGLNEQMIIVVLKHSSQLVQALLSHVNEQSDQNIKRYRRVAVSHQYGASIATIKSETAALNDNHRAIYVAFDGGKPLMNSWENIDGYNVDTGTATSGDALSLTDSTKTYTADQWKDAKIRITGGTGLGQIRNVKTNTASKLTVSEVWGTVPDSTSTYDVRKVERYTVDKQVDGEWLALAVVARIAALPDTATPLTRKYISGFNTGSATLWLDAEKDEVAEAGGCVLEDVNGAIQVRHGITSNYDLIENREISVVQAEDTMRIALTMGLNAFIGQKLTNDMKIGVENTTVRILRNLVFNEIIRSYDEDTLEITEDPTDPTRLIIIFNYQPIYPINRIEFRYAFSLAA